MRLPGSEKDVYKRQVCRCLLQGGVRMLGKLMKYEWKNIWRAGTLMLLGMFVVTVIGCVVLRMPGGLVTEIVDGNDINAAQSWFVVSSLSLIHIY